MQKDISTEVKIKEAAKKIFRQKGFGLTRTRDIAEEAGINLALLNYYYRSKQKLFEIVMTESLSELFSFFSTIINDSETCLSEKIDLVVNQYIQVVLKNRNLPLFVMNELQTNPADFIKKGRFPKDFLLSSIMFRQIEQQLKEKNLDIHPLHFFINIVSLSVFPIIGETLITNFHHMEEEEYLEFINQRKTLIPLWIKQILKIAE